MKKFKLSRRRMLGSLGAIGAASAGAGAGTWAYFQDNSTSGGNTVSSGTIDLDVKDSGTPRYILSPPTAPGSGVDTDVTLNVFNKGTIRGDHVEIDVSNDTIEDQDGTIGATETPHSNPSPDSDNSTGDGLSKYVEVEQLSYGVDSNGDGNFASGEMTKLIDDSVPQSTSYGKLVSTDLDSNFISLYDLADSSNESVLDGLPTPKAGTTRNSPGRAKFFIQVSLHHTTPNNFQGDVLKTEIAFRLNQDSSQDS